MRRLICYVSTVHRLAMRRLICYVSTGHRLAGAHADSTVHADSSLRYVRTGHRVAGRSGIPRRKEKESNSKHWGSAIHSGRVIRYLSTAL
eukprot:2854425-Rhodomonas_salina.6